MEIRPNFRSVTMGKVLGKLIGANMNVTTDQAIPITLDTGTKYYIEKILITNASISLDTAVGGFYPAAAKGGTAIVANTQVYSALTSAAATLSATIASTVTQTASPIYLSLTTPQGAAATADVYVIGYVL